MLSVRDLLGYPPILPAERQVIYFDEPLAASIPRPRRHPRWKRSGNRSVSPERLAQIQAWKRANKDKVAKYARDYTARRKALKAKEAR